MSSFRVIKTTLEATHLGNFQDKLAALRLEHYEEALATTQAAVQTAQRVVQGPAPPANAAALLAQAQQDHNTTRNRGIAMAEDGRAAGIDIAMRHVLAQAIPPSAVKKVKKCIRRDCRKPSDMSVREFYEKILYVNNEEIPLLPTFKTDPVENMLSDDELVDILMCAAPNSWERELERLGFDPADHPSNEVLLKLEQIEAAESFDRAPRAEGKGNKKSKTSPSKKPSSGQDKYCLIHGKCGHTSNDCNALKAKAKEAKSFSNDKKGSWSDKAKANKSKTDKEMAAFIKKQVDSNVEKILAKREREVNNVDMADVDFDDLTIDV